MPVTRKRLRELLLGTWDLISFIRLTCEDCIVKIDIAWRLVFLWIAITAIGTPSTAMVAVTLASEAGSVARRTGDIAQGTPQYAFVDKDLRSRAGAAVEKGIRCILDCQIVVDGKKTAWCAQHDEKTLVPRKARSYELASLSGGESVGIVRFLMDIDRPGLEVIEAVQGAVAWFDAVKLEGIRQITREDRSQPRGVDKVVIRDPSAPPMWARFHEIGTNQPIFCSRDGVPKKRSR